VKSWWNGAISFETFVVTDFLLCTTIPMDFNIQVSFPSCWGVRVGNFGKVGVGAGVGYFTSNPATLHVTSSNWCIDHKCYKWSKHWKPPHALLYDAEFLGYFARVLRNIWWIDVTAIMAVIGWLDELIHVSASKGSLQALIARVNSSLELLHWGMGPVSDVTMFKT